MSPCLSFSISSSPDFLVDEQRRQQAAAELGARPPAQTMRSALESQADVAVDQVHGQLALACFHHGALEFRAWLDAELLGEATLIGGQREVGGEQRGLAGADDLDQVETWPTPPDRSAPAGAGRPVRPPPRRRCRCRSRRAPHRRWPATRARCRAGCSARRRARRWRAAAYPARTGGASRQSRDVARVAWASMEKTACIRWPVVGPISTTAPIRRRCADALRVFRRA